MSELFVIHIFKRIVSQLAPILKVLGYSLILPQYLLKSPKLSHFAAMRSPNTSNDVWPNRYHSLSELLSHTGFYLVYLFFCFNLHFACFFYLILHCTVVELVVAYTMIHLLTAIFYKLADIKFFIWRDPPHLMMCILHLLCYIIICVSYILSFFMSPEFKNFLMFQLQEEYDTDTNTPYYSYMKIAQLLVFLLNGILYGVLYLVYHIAVLVQMLNPLAIPRICTILANESHYLTSSTLMSLLMFLVDIVYLVLYIFNILFFKSFIQNHIMLFKRNFPPETAYIRDYPIYYKESQNFHLYFYKNVIIDPAYSNFFYIINWACYLLVDVLWYSFMKLLAMLLTVLTGIYSFISDVVFQNILKVYTQLCQFFAITFIFIFSRIINPIWDFFKSESSIAWVKFASCISWCYVFIKPALVFIFQTLPYITSNFLVNYFFSPMSRGFEKVTDALVFIYKKICDIISFTAEKISQYFVIAGSQLECFMSYLFTKLYNICGFLYTMLSDGLSYLCSKCYSFIELCLINLLDLLVYLYGKLTYCLVKLWDLIVYLYGKLTYCLVKLWDLIVYLYGKLTYCLVKLLDLLVYVSKILWNAIVYLYDKLTYCLTKTCEFLIDNYDKIIYGLDKIFNCYLPYGLTKIYQLWLFIYPYIKYVLIDLLFQILIPKIYRLLESIIIKAYTYWRKHPIDFTRLGLNTLYYLIQGLIYIITPITLFINHISPIHVISFYGIIHKSKNAPKGDADEEITISYLDYNLFIYAHKTFDAIVLIFRLAIMIACPVHTVGNVIFSMSKGCVIKSLFQLIGEEEYDYLGSKDEVTRLDKFFWSRRSEALRNLLYDIIPGVLLNVNLILLITPLYGLNYVTPFVEFFSQCRKAEEIGYEQVKSEFNNKIYTTARYFPLLFLSFLMAILSIDPYNLFLSVKLCYRISIKKPIEEMRSLDQRKDEEKEYKNHMEEATNWLYSSEIYQFYGITLPFKFITVHLTVVRGILFWSKFRKCVAKHQNVFDVFVNLITLNFYNAITEWPLYPILVLILLLSPTRFRQIKKVLSSSSLEEKFFMTVKMLGCLIDDVFTIFLVVFGIFTLSQTVEMIALLYASYKRYYINDEISLIRYASYYNNDFKGEVKNITIRVLRNYLIVLLLILNLFLILSVPDLWRRFSPFLNKKIRNTVLFFYPHRGQSKEKSLLEINNSSFVCIAQFLMPGEIGRLSKICPELHTKIEIGLIWRNLYENYYAKELQKHKKDLLLRMLHIDNFRSYKRMCEEAHKALIKHITVLTEQERDEILGITNVFIEEFLNGLMKYPHVLLTPIKFLSLILVYIIPVLEITQSLFQKFAQNALNITLISPFSITLDLQSRIGDMNFYTIHLHGLVALINFPLFVIISLWNFLVILFTFLQKLGKFLYDVIIRPLRAFVNLVYQILGLCRDFALSVYNAITPYIWALFQANHRFLVVTCNILYEIVTNAGSIVEFALFPHFELFKAINKQALQGKNAVVVLIANILGLVFIIFPFALNYFVPKTMITLIIVNSYGVVNAYKFVTLQ